MPTELRKDELDRYISDAVSKHTDASFSQLNDRIDGLRKDLFGDARAEEMAEGRNAGLAMFRNASSGEWGNIMRDVRSSLFNTKMAARRHKLPFFKASGGDEFELGSGELFTRMLPLVIRAMGSDGPRWEVAARIAEENGNKDLSDWLRNKTLQAQDFDAGGALIPEVMAADFIGFLYSSSVVRRAGVRTIDMSDGRPIRLGRQNSTAAASWLGENAEVPASQGTYGDLRLDLKTLGVFVPLSEDLIRAAVGDFVELVRDDATMVAALAEDLALLRSDGSANRPKGILHWTRSANKFNSAGDTHANKHEDLIKSAYLVEASDVPTPGPKWFMNPRAVAGLLNTLTTDGMPPFMLEYAASRTFNGSPVLKTTQIPVNLGGGTNESEIYYVEPSQCVIGEGMQMSVAESNVATYNDGANQRNAFQRFERVIRLGHKVDFVMRHDSAASVIQQVTYGDSFD